MFGIAINPRAGYKPRKKERLFSEVKKYLGVNETNIVGREAKSAAAFKKEVKNLAQDVETIVSIGGDGTLSDVINSLHEEKLLSTHGIIPIMAGSGNALQHLTRQPKKNVTDWLAKREENYLDLLIDGNIAGLMSSIGYEAQAAALREKKVSAGKHPFISYFTAGVKTMREFKPYTATIELDNQTIQTENGFTIIVCKSPYYGEGIRVFDEDKLDDGMLQVRVIEGEGKTALPIAWRGLTRKRIDLGTTYTTKKLNILTERPQHQQVDGSPTRTGTQFNYEVLAKALKLEF